MESKWYKFLDTLPEVEANNGDFGYFCTVGDMLDNGGRDDFFRTWKWSFTVEEREYGPYIVSKLEKLLVI